MRDDFPVEVRLFPLINLERPRLMFREATSWAEFFGWVPANIGLTSWSLMIDGIIVQNTVIFKWAEDTQPPTQLEERRRLILEYLNKTFDKSTICRGRFTDA